MLLSVERMEISRVLLHLAVPAGNHVVERLAAVASVFHRDFAVLFKRHLEVGVESSSGSGKNHGGIERNVFSVDILEVFVISTTKERGYRRFNGREFLVVPVNAHDERVSDVAGEPDVRYHSLSVGIAESYGLVRLYRDAGVQLFAVPTVSAAVSRACRIFRGKRKARSVFH